MTFLNRILGKTRHPSFWWYGVLGGVAATALMTLAGSITNARLAAQVGDHREPNYKERDQGAPQVVVVDRPIIIERYFNTVETPVIVERREYVDREVPVVVEKPVYIDRMVETILEKEVPRVEVREVLVEVVPIGDQPAWMQPGNIIYWYRDGDGHKSGRILSVDSRTIKVNWCSGTDTHTVPFAVKNFEGKPRPREAKKIAEGQAGEESRRAGGSSSDDAQRNKLNDSWKNRK